MPKHHPLFPGGDTLAVLDACVLLPPRLSDVLFDLYLEGLYLPYWTRKIEDEFLKHWAEVIKRGMSAGVALASDGGLRRLECFRSAVQHRHEIVGYDDPAVLRRIPQSVHKGDMHVIGAALSLSYGAETERDKVLVVTSNKSHMAVRDVAKFGIEIVQPGAFIDMLCAVAEERVSLSTRFGKYHVGLEESALYTGTLARGFARARSEALSRVRSAHRWSEGDVRAGRNGSGGRVLARVWRQGLAGSTGQSGGGMEQHPALSGGDA